MVDALDEVYNLCQILSTYIPRPKHHFVDSDFLQLIFAFEISLIKAGILWVCSSIGALFDYWRCSLALGGWQYLTLSPNEGGRESANQRGGGALGTSV